MGFCVTGLGRGQPERVVWRRDLVIRAVHKHREKLTTAEKPRKIKDEP